MRRPTPDRKASMDNRAKRSGVLPVIMSWIVMGHVCVLMGLVS